MPPGSIGKGLRLDVDSVRDAGDKAHGRETSSREGAGRYAKKRVNDAGKK